MDSETVHEALASDTYIFPGFELILPILGGINQHSPRKRKELFMEMYKNPHAELSNRVDDLCSRMTLREKIRQLDMFFGSDLLDSHRPECVTIAPRGAHVDCEKYSAAVGADGVGFIHDLYPFPELYNEFQRHIIEQSRLGIPAIFIEEALRGLCKPGCTIFPSQVALASTFHPELARETGRAIATEARAAGIHGVLGPTMDLTREPRWGRVEESYGEDTCLAAEMAGSMVRGLQGDGIDSPDAVMAEPKHFAAHGVPEGGLNCAPAMMGEREVRTSVLPVFEEAVKEAGAYNVMCSYNSIDGIPCANHEELLTGVLRDQWQMRGVVIADLGAVWRTQSVHHTSGSNEDTVADAWNAGTDVQFYDFPHDEFLAAMERALQNGKLHPDALERSVKRVLALKFRLGLFEHPYIEEDRFAKVNRCEKHLDIADRSSRESICLLKNDGILPLSRTGMRVAVVGPNADAPYFGGYVPYLEDIEIVSPLDGIRHAAPDCEVTYAKGVEASENAFEPVPMEWMWAKDGTPGFSGSYYATATDTEPVFVRQEGEMNFNWAMSKPSDQLPNSGYRVVWEGFLCSDRDFSGKLGFTGDDTVSVVLNGKELLRAQYGEDGASRTAAVTLKQGERYAIQMEYQKLGGGYEITFGYGSDGVAEWEEGLRTASSADIVVAVMGDSKRTCSEGFDRSELVLPGRQRGFLKAVRALGKPVVLVLQTGRPVALSWESTEMNAILNLFSPADNGGRALAEVLFGSYNPAGRLPVSFPKSTGNIPCYYNRQPGATGRYVDDSPVALYPFGHGLSYTTFAYEGLRLSLEETVLRAGFTLHNTGKRDGEEVVQLYTRDVVASVVRPERELKSFRRIFVPAGESVEVELEIPLRRLAVIDRKFRRVVEAGDFEVMVGASSTDIRLQGTITLLTELLCQ